MSAPLTPTTAPQPAQIDAVASIVVAVRARLRDEEEAATSIARHDGSKAA